MTKISWWWKRLVFVLATWEKTELTQNLRVLCQVGSKRASKKSKKILPWFFGSLIAVQMIEWNGSLLGATFAGMGVMLLVYRLQLGIWENYLLKCQQFLKTASGKLTLSVACGAMASCLTYLGASIWLHSSNRWLATGIILDGFGILLILLLIGWHLLTRRIKNDEVKFEQLLLQLTDNSPLRRLIAVRQLTQLVNNPILHSAHRRQLQEYFQLMLAVEQEAVIRETLLNNLQNSPQTPALTETPAPLNIPVTLKKYLYL